MSVIEAIYNGDFYPAEQVKPDSEAFRVHSQTVQALSVMLYDILDEEQRGILDEYQSESAIVTDLYNLEFYRAGVKFGVQLLLEALYGCAEPPETHK